MYPLFRALFFLSLLFLGLLTRPYAYGQSKQDRPRAATSKILFRNHQGTPGNPVALEATLVVSRSRNIPLPGRKLTFVARWGTTTKTPWTMIGSAETDDNGVASIDINVPTSIFDKVPTGQVYVEVRFSGDANYVDNVRYLKDSVRGWLYISRLGDDDAPPINLPSTPTTKQSAVAPKSSTSPSSSQDKQIPHIPEPAESGDDSGDEDSPPPIESESPTTKMTLTPMLLRKVIGDIAGREDAASISSGMKLSPDAVPLVKDGFAISPPRFWFEAKLEKLHVQEKKIGGIAIPIPIFEVEAVVNYRIVDTYTNCEWKGTERKRKDVPKLIGEYKPSKQLAGFLQLSKIKNSNGTSNEPPGSSKMVVDIGPLMKTDDGQVLIKALEQAVKVAKDKLNRADWIIDIIDVDNKIITLNSGVGVNLKSGDKLIVKRYERTISGRDGNAKDVRYTHVGVIEVVKIQQDYIEARIVDGSDFEKGDLAFKNGIQ
jgi:hypothetical protein